MTGGGGYFFVLLALCTVVTTVVCRQKECSRAPSWTENGVNHLNQHKGNVTLLALMNFSSRLCLEQTLRMDTLLKDLQDYGMYDLSFIAVNSKSPPTTEMYYRIKDKISFPVYQEQDEEKIWDIMDGETNDMFIYDKCGRLTYFIPFPLSDLRSKQTVVRAAILSTYFRSPCGSACNNYAANDVQDIIEEEEEERNDEYESQDVIQSNNTDVIEDFGDAFPQFENATNMNNEIMLPEDYNSEVYTSLSNTTTNNTAIEDIASDAENQYVTTQKPAPVRKGLLDFFMEFLWKRNTPSKSTLENSLKEQENSTSREKEQDTEMKLEEVIINNEENETSAEIEETDDDSLFESTEETNDITPIIVEDVCLGIDANLCSEWSKSKLLHAQKCCLLATQDNEDRQGKGCKNLGRKRCKKIQPILKCCLKTEMQQSPKEKIRNAL